MPWSRQRRECRSAVRTHRASDLPRLYGDMHFAWAVDFYEAGSNSDWLLPNKLYEAGLFGAVPIACRDVATGAWLAERGVGVLLEGDLVIRDQQIYQRSRRPALWRAAGWPGHAAAHHIPL